MAKLCEWPSCKQPSKQAIVGYGFCIPHGDAFAHLLNKEVREILQELARKEAGRKALQEKRE